jgi:hypothetical protein
MYVISLKIKPGYKHQDYGKVAGGFAAVFIDFIKQEGAIELAQYYLEQQEWEVTEIDEELGIVESVADVSSEALESYKLARKHGYFISLHTYTEE